MARNAYGDQSDVESDRPVDEIATPPVSTPPSSPPTPDEAPPTSQTMTRPIGSSFSDLGPPGGATRPLVETARTDTADQGGQEPSSLENHANDLAAVQNTLLATLNSSQFSVAERGHVQAILSDLTSAISAANATTSAAGALASTAGAGQVLRAAQLSMMNAIDTDPVLATPAPAEPLPTAQPEAPPSLAEIGEKFDDVAGQILGGVTDDNRAEITDDINALISDMQALMKASPELFEGETGAHADAIVQQLQLELVYINDPAMGPGAVEASTDNILDIIDLVQSDTKLADLAKQGGLDGFSPIPGADTPAVVHLDGDEQTAFQANFIAQSNSLGQQAVGLVGSSDAPAIAALIDDLRSFEKSVSDLDPSQGSVLGAEIQAMIKGLQTGNVDLVAAAADQMHGRAVDIGVSNIPATGGSYNTNGVTVAEVLDTTPAATEEAPSSVPDAEPAPLTGELAATANVDLDPLPEPELMQLHQMWG
jgi:hypothetical protein